MKLLFLITFLTSMNLSASDNYSKITGQINRLTNRYSFLEKFTLGKNDQRKNIEGVLYRGEGLSNVKHLIVAAHHGDELLSVDLAIKFIEHLGKKGERLLKGKDVYIIPVLNVSGYNREEREELDSSGRSHDPNRDYPDPCVSKRNFKLRSTSALEAFLKSNDIVGAITIHGYYGSLSYPWGIYTDNYRTLDHEIFHEKAIRAVSFNSYDVGTHADLLYPAAGAFEDWAYHELGVWSLLVELENRPKFEDDVSMLVSSLRSFPSKRSRNHGHLGNCQRVKDFGISRP